MLENYGFDYCVNGKQFSAFRNNTDQRLTGAIIAAFKKVKLYPTLNYAWLW